MSVLRAGMGPTRKARLGASWWFVVSLIFEFGHFRSAGSPELSRPNWTHLQGVCSDFLLRNAPLVHHEPFLEPEKKRLSSLKALSRLAGARAFFEQIAEFLIF